MTTQTCPTWCHDHVLVDDQITHSSPKAHADIYHHDAHSRIEMYEYTDDEGDPLDPNLEQTLAVMSIATDIGDEVRMSLPELDSLIAALTTTRQRLADAVADRA